MSRTAERSDFGETTRIRLLEIDADDFDSELTALRSEFKVALDALRRQNTWILTLFVTLLIEVATALAIVLLTR